MVPTFTGFPKPVWKFGTQINFQKVVFRCYNYYSTFSSQDNLDDKDLLNDETKVIFE